MKTQAPRKLVSMTPEMAKRVDDYRWGNRINTESEALRRLVRMGLEAADRKSNSAEATHE